MRVHVPRWIGRGDTDEQASHDLRPSIRRRSCACPAVEAGAEVAALPSPPPYSMHRCVQMARAASLARRRAIGSSARAHAAHVRRCLGHRRDKRACVFRNLYYDTQRSTFVYLHNPAAPPRIVVSGRETNSSNFTWPSVPGDSFMDTGFLRWPTGVDGQSADFPLVGVDALPDVHAGAGALVAHRPGLSVVWEAYVHVAITRSFGHFILNEMLPLYLVLTNLLPTIPPSFALLLVLRKDLSTALFDHIAEPFARQPVRRLEEALTVPPGVRYVHFCELVVGEGGIQATSKDFNYPHKSLASFFQNQAWQGFRAAVVTRAGLPPPELPMRPKIVLLQKGLDTWGKSAKSSDRRLITNIGELHDHLERAFPYAQVGTPGTRG